MVTRIGKFDSRIDSEKRDFEKNQQKVAKSCLARFGCQEKISKKNHQFLFYKLAIWSFPRNKKKQILNDRKSLD